MIACVFESCTGYSVVWAELARNDLEWAHGLSRRTWLPPDHGMLFAFDAPAPRALWMRDTLIPLDMIFVDADGVVVHIEEAAKPLSLRLYGTNTPAQFVIEVGARWARTHGVEVGAVVSFAVTLCR